VIGTVDTDPGDTATGEMRLVQIALSCLDKARTRDWYVDVLGFLPAGEMTASDVRDAHDVGATQGVPGAALEVSWAIDRQSFFQLEFFQYQEPEVRVLPARWRPCDIGYTTIGVHVAAFDATLTRLAEASTPLLSDPVGPRGNRRVCARDPDGVLVELMEDDPRTPDPDRRSRPEVPVVTRSLTASVPDLERSRRFFEDTLGLRRAGGCPGRCGTSVAVWVM
jgi:catechol 2,3-dioxygenase-like lactoylglutathione lyase family enzyme